MPEQDMESRRAALTAEQRALLERRLQGDSSPSYTTIPRHKVRTAAPLSFAQERLWYLAQLMPESTLYNEQIVLPAKFALNVGALERALDAIVQRHEILRTRFVTQMGSPVQVVEPAMRLPLDVINLRHVPAQLREEQAQQQIRRQAQTSFVLSALPLLRTALLQFADDDTLLIVTLHHIVTDGWSIGIFVRELTALYGAITSGKPSPLLPLPIQYADYAIWERERLRGETLDKLLAYWTRRLQNLPVLHLPTDYPRPRVPSFHGAQHRFTIAQDVHQQLRAITAQQQCTLNTALLAVFALLLQRYSQQDEFPIGMPVANRGGPQELETLIGFFVNTLVLRVDLSGHPNFIQLLQRIREVTVGALEHQALPFEMLVEHLQPERDLSSNPLCQVAFQVLPRSLGSRFAEGQSNADLHTGSGNSKFDLRMDVFEYEDRLVGSVEYSTDLFAPATIVQLADHYKNLLQGAVANPNAPVSQLPMLSEHERRQLIVEWNTSKSIPPVAFTGLHQWVEQHAQCRPAAPAVVFAGKTLSYAVLNRKANQLARYLRRLGVRRESLVGLHLSRSLEMIVGLLAVLKAGGAFVPFDPAYPADRLRFMLEDCGLRLLLTQAALQQTFQQDGLTVLPLDTLDTGAEEVEDGQADLATEVDPHQLAYVIYTSGSSGVPKGVLVEHRGLLNVARVQQETFSLDANSRVLQFSSLSFDAAVFEIMMAFFSGGALYLGAQESLHPGIPLLRFLQDNAITIVTLPPSALAALPAQELPALATITVAGEACPAGLVDKWAPGRQFFNLYGPTEATIWATYAECEANRGKPAIGRPIANVQAYVMDRDGNLLPSGVPGELVIGGVGIARGYLKRDALTAERFIADPFAGQPQARLYRTGDLVRYKSDGQLDFLGRLDQQVKLRGYRIEIGEIETVLVQHPLVRDVAVVQRDVAGEPSLSAYIVAVEQARLAPADLQAYLQQRLPGFMVPAHYIFLEALPLLPNGKVDRKTLSALESAPPTAAFALPQTDCERLIAEIWQSCLKVDRVGLYDNFFDLGGHSLLLAMVHLRLVEALKIDVPLVVLFQYPTVKLLAEHLTSSLKPAPEEVREPSPMLDTQARAERQREMLRSLRSGDKAYKGRL